jgi:hypothetical protein
MESDKYFEYYQAQSRGIGGGFKGGRGQKGAGLGSFLAGMFRRVFPYLKQGAQALGHELLDTSKNLLRSKLNNEDMKESLDKHLTTAGRNLGTKAAASVQSMLGMGYKKRKTSTKAHSTAAKRRCKKTNNKKASSKKTRKRTIKRRRDIFS